MKKILVIVLVSLITLKGSFSQNLSFNKITKEELMQWKSDTLGCDRLRSRIFNKHFKARTESRNYLLKGRNLSEILSDLGQPNKRHLNDDGEVSSLIYFLGKRSCGDGHIEANLDVLFEDGKVKSHWLSIE